MLKPRIREIIDASHLIVGLGGLKANIRFTQGRFSQRRTIRMVSSGRNGASTLSFSNTKHDKSDNNLETTSAAITTPQAPYSNAHRKAISSGSETYVDPSTGYTVFTELSHLKRGKCCGNMCRHCPYDWANVSTERLKTWGQGKKPDVIIRYEA